MTEDNSENKERRQSPIRIVLHNFISFIVFLIILGFLNMFIDYFDSNILFEVVRLLNNNIRLIFVF